MKYLVTGRGADLEVSMARADSTTESANWKTRPAALKELNTHSTPLSSHTQGVQREGYKWLALG